MANASLTLPCKLSNLKNYVFSSFHRPSSIVHRPSSIAHRPAPKLLLKWCSTDYLVLAIVFTLLALNFCITPIVAQVIPPVPPQYGISCGNSDEIESESAASGLTCQPLSHSFSLSAPHIPYIPTTDDPILTIKVNLIFIAKDDGTGMFSASNPEHVQVWNDIEAGMNSRFSQLIEPNYSGNNSTCQDNFAPFLSNARIQFALEPVYINNSALYDIPECNAHAVRQVYQPFLDLNYPELRCSNSINVVMPTDEDNLIDILTNGAAYTSCYTANAIFPSFTNFNEVGYSHFPNLFSKYEWMRTVEADSDNAPYPWDPVVKNWFIETYIGGLLHEIGHNLGLGHNNAVHGSNQCQNSIMHQDGSAPRNFLPPIEIGKMHRALAHSSVRSTVSENSYSSNPILITENTLWDTNRKLYRPVVVQSGKTLTITCKILFHPNASIRIEPNARLIVDGGHLTNFCDALWAGIIVEGNPSQHQYAYSGGQYYQGRAIFKNDALIENASVGVRNWNPANWGIGGIIQATNATFKNCWKGAEFMKYQNFSPLNSSFPHPEQSYFRKCDFLVDDDYLRDQNVSPAEAGVTIWKSDRLRFEGCTFTNTSTLNQSENRVHGIYSHDANYIVQGFCTDPIIQVGVPCQNVLPTTFTGWHKAIEATETTNVPITVRQSVFDKNMIGVEINGADYSQIYDNEFNLGGHPYQYEEEPTIEDQNHLGIYVNETEHYSIEDNIFTRPTQDAPYEGHGVLVFNSLGAENQVYKNTFSRLKTGANGWQVNRNTETEGGVQPYYAGLQFLCNTNSQNSVDFEISRSGSQSDLNWNDHGIRLGQGSLTPPKAASNSFSAGDPDPLTFTHFTINSYGIYGYFHNGTNTPSPQEIGPGAMGIIPIVVSTNCPSHYTTSGGGIKNKTELTGIKTEFDGLDYTYRQIIDEGNTPGTVTEIELTWPQNAWDLHNELMQRAPYNSETVLIAAIQRNIMPHPMLLEVLLANPDALRSGTVIREAETAPSPPLPAYMIDLLWASRDQTTLRTSMESTLADLHMEVQRIQKKMILQKAFADSTYNAPDSTLYYLSKVKTVEGNYSRAGALAGRNQYSQAIALLDSMQVNYKLSDERYAEMTALKNLFGLLSTAHGGGRTIANLSPSEVESMKALAESETAGIAAQKAQNALCFHYDICYDAQGQPKHNAAPRQPKPTYEELVAKLNTVNAYPNPSDQYVTIAFTLLHAKDKTALHIFDAIGRQVESRTLGSVYEGQQLLDTRKMANGVYLFQIVQDGNKLSEGKFVVIH